MRVLPCFREVIPMSMRSRDPFWQGEQHLPASAFAVVVVTLVMIAIAQFWPSSPTANAFIPERHSSMVFPFQGTEWVAAPVAQTLRTPDAGMALVETRNEVGLYAPVGGGGGGAQGGQLFVRLDEGMYLPLRPVTP